MSKQRHIRLFNRIAPMYGWFYRRQKTQYYQLLGRFKQDLAFSPEDSFLDIGCGSGAFMQALHEQGFNVKGLDASKRMLKTAQKKTSLGSEAFTLADATESLPFENKTFDTVFASYVAHGLDRENRQKLYRNMHRLAKKWVILHDYHNKKRLVVSVIETLERGHYFEFIKVVKDELEACISNNKPCFKSVTKRPINKHASWYICEVND